MRGGWGGGGGEIVLNQNFGITWDLTKTQQEVFTKFLLCAKLAQLP